MVAMAVKNFICVECSEGIAVLGYVNPHEKAEVRRMPGFCLCFSRCSQRTVLNLPF